MTGGQKWLGTAHSPMQVGLGVFSLACRCGPASSAPYPAGSVRSGLALEMPGTERGSVGLDEWGGLGARLSVHRRALSGKATERLWTPLRSPSCKDMGNR